MIATIEGRIIGIKPDNIVVEIGGIGLQVFVPSQLIVNLRQSEIIQLHTYLVVREDSLTLYGFGNEEEKDFFVLLLGVNGVGPRLALAGISTLNPDTIRRAVYTEQPDIFAQIPGVGKKTAQKILLHLQDKVKTTRSYTENVPIDETGSQVLEALVTLGYSVVEAQSALQSIPKETPENVEDRIVAALKYFSQ